MISGHSVKAVGFDLGDTLIYYDGVSLNWSALYRDALKKVAYELHTSVDDNSLLKAEDILSRYNTRLHPRDHEVKDVEIFGEILHEWGLKNECLDAAIIAFFRFFQQQSKVFNDTLTLLKTLKQRKIRTGILTDVPYGMNKKLVLQDIESVSDYIDVVITSVEVGYRKPRPEGFMELSKQLGTKCCEMVFVGNERKDILGANQAGMQSVFVDRKQIGENWGQRWRIANLAELLKLL